MNLFKKSSKSTGWRAVVLDDTSLHAVAVQVDNGKPIVSLAFTVLDSGEGMGRTLGNLAQAWQGTGYRCTTLLARREYQFLPVEAPPVPPTELKSAVSWRIRDMLDFPVEEAAIDVLNIPQEKGMQRQQMMYAVAAPMRLIEQRQRWFGEARMPLGVIDIPEMAQRNIAALFEQTGRGLAMLWIDSQGGLLTLTAGGELYFARWIDVPLDQLVLGSHELKEDAFGQVTLEVQRSLDHFSRQYRSIVLAKLLVAPLAESDPGLTAYLEKNVDIPVEALDLSAVFDFSKVPQLRDPGKQRQYWLALGAALRHEEKVL